MITPERVRGCGTRVKSGVYLEVEISESGIPPEHWNVCPPRPVDVEALRLKPMGVSLIEVNGITHVFDWVGSSHYPNVADFLMEMRRLGVSRRISRTADFASLTPDSRLVLLHSRAVIANANDVWQAVWEDLSVGWPCPVHGVITPGGHAPGMCHSLYREMVEGGEMVDEKSGRAVDRTIGNITYRANMPPAGVAPECHVGIFAVLPIGRIAVIADEEDEHEESLTSALRSSLPVSLERS